MMIMTDECLYDKRNGKKIQFPILLKKKKILIRILRTILYIYYIIYDVQ